ncbi:tyrosine-type recombinase/integrase [Halorubrum sp. JWXQ-INN 858]|uniref:tyrosine-type recombinase/integrase n=1 Tax=Halorubrum sp. JWXQ-INN 858 TaxID=2690782 RepID=UPI00135CDE65|nr:tyrosine-type recombinase/integrase [Halorubrum sp. JWXQ-INN 858]
MHEKMISFVEILRGMDKASSTVDEYEKGLKLYSSWLESQDLEPADVTTRELQRYLGWLKAEKGYAPKTIRLKFVAVNQFHQDLASTGDGETNPAEDVTVTDYAPKRTRKEESSKERRHWLSKEDVEKLVKNVPSPQVRNRLIVLFQYFTGLRRQEVCDVKISDLDREQRKAQVRGKNGKVHTAKWQPKLDGLLTAWLDMGHRDASPYARESDFLFVTESGPQLSGSHLNNIVKQAAENAGIQEVVYVNAGGSNQYKITSHTLRHSFAMHWLENGGSLEGLSKNLAHSSVTTTEIYGEILEERASEEYEQFAPDVNFSF